ncbi:unnamed protein product, partial [Pylaiella littoralis]
MFTCHMCNRQQNVGQLRIGVRDIHNEGHGWNHFCLVCWRTEQSEGAQAVRRGPWDSDGTLGTTVGSSAAEGGIGSGGGAQAGSLPSGDDVLSGGACCGAGDLE